jgi:hypothetical protein
MRPTLTRRWKKLKRHLRSCMASARALRDAARASAAGAPDRECLCRPSLRLAA